jgi:hypothetical protein
MNTHPSSIYHRHHSPSRNFIHGGTNTISSLCYNTQVASAANVIPQVRISSAVKMTKNLAVCCNIQVACTTTKSFSTLEFHPRWTNISHHHPTPEEGSLQPSCHLIRQTGNLGKIVVDQLQPTAMSSEGVTVDHAQSMVMNPPEAAVDQTRSMATNIKKKKKKLLKIEQSLP